MMKATTNRARQAAPSFLGVVAKLLKGTLQVNDLPTGPYLTYTRTPPAVAVPRRPRDT